jgi:excisionase family DNA binding protein
MTDVDGVENVAAEARGLSDAPSVSPVALLPLYTPTEAARLLAVPESWLRRRVTARQAPHTVLGKHLRFSHADLVAIATAAARPAATAVSARRPRRGRGPRPTTGW